jgi:hypothetical protein
MAALGTLYNAVRQQAAMLSYIDVFHTLMITVFACLPLLRVRRGQRGAASAGGAA